MWIDVISPEDKEIYWPEGLLQLSPTVVADLLREDRRYWCTLVIFSFHYSSRIHKAMGNAFVSFVYALSAPFVALFAVCCKTRLWVMHLS